jgi:2-aminoadipate transaminase
LELVNDLLLAPGDTVIAEEASYASALSRIRARGVDLLGAVLDDDGIVPDKLAAQLRDLKSKGVRPKFVYTIPTVQNPTGTIMSRQRRLEILKIAAEYDVLIFEDDCYADLTWNGERPPAFRALDDSSRVIYCGSFSKTLAPALRIGYMVADQAVIARLLPLKRDAGSGAVEQMVLAEFAKTGLDSHITALSETFQGKCAVMSAALAEQFGAAAEFDAPKGGIFTWITLPDTVDTTRLAQIAAAEGVTINPGADWSADPETGKHRFRLCFGYPSHAEIRDGVARLAEICHREFGIPLRGGNVERTADQ